MAPILPRLSIILAFRVQSTVVLRSSMRGSAASCAPASPKIRTIRFCISISAVARLSPRLSIAPDCATITSIFLMSALYCSDPYSYSNFSIYPILSRASAALFLTSSSSSSKATRSAGTDFSPICSSASTALTLTHHSGSFKILTRLCITEGCPIIPRACDTRVRTKGTGSETSSSVRFTMERSLLIFPSAPADRARTSGLTSSKASISSFTALSA